MNERIIRTNDFIKGKYPWLTENEHWVVLSENMHEVIFSGPSFEYCERWLRTQCQSCEGADHEDG